MEVFCLRQRGYLRINSVLEFSGYSPWRGHPLQPFATKPRYPVSTTGFNVAERLQACIVTAILIAHNPWQFPIAGSFNQTVLDSFWGFPHLKPNPSVSFLVFDGRTPLYQGYGGIIFFHSPIHLSFSRPIPHARPLPFKTLLNLDIFKNSSPFAKNAKKVSLQIT